MSSSLESTRTTEQLISKLEAASQRSKASTKLGRHRFEWIKENRQLERKRHLAETSLLSLLQPSNRKGKPHRRPHSVVRHARGLNGDVDASNAADRAERIKCALEGLRAPGGLLAGFQNVLESYHVEREELRSFILGIQSLMRQPCDESERKEIGTMIEALKERVGRAMQELEMQAVDLGKSVNADCIKVLSSYRVEEQRTRTDRAFSKQLEELVSEVEQHYSDETQLVSLLRSGEARLNARRQKTDAQLRDALSEMAQLRKKKRQLAKERFNLDRFNQLANGFMRRNTPRKGCIERLELEFPKVKRQVFNAVLEVHETLKMSQQRVTDMEENYRRVLQDEHMQLVKSVLKHIAQIDERRNREHIVEEHQNKIALIRKRLEVARAEYAKRQHAIAELKAQEARHEAAVNQGKEEAARRKALIQKKLLESYRQQQEMEERLNQLSVDQNALKMQEELRERRVHNRDRVRFRAQEMQRKLDERRDQEESQFQEQLQLECRLEELKAKVPYFQKLKEITPDADRTRQRTFSSAADAEYRNYNKDGLFKLKSFSSDSVCGDLRFRLIDKLRQRGLHQSPYAQSLVRSMNQSQLVRRNIHES